LYSIKKQNETLNRFINMGVFKFVKNQYYPAGDTALPSTLNVYYYLTPLKKKTITAELGGFTKSNSFTGAQVNLNWRNRNLFKGAEQLHVKTFGAFEVSTKDSLSKNNNFRVGTEIAFITPRLVVPYKKQPGRIVLPSTKLSFGYEWMRRQLLYTNNFLRFQYVLTWKQKSNIEHSLSPFSITSNFQMST